MARLEQYVTVTAPLGKRRYNDLYRKIIDRVKIGRFEMITTNEDNELKKRGLHEITYCSGIVCCREEPEYNETAFQKVYRMSTGRHFRDDINDLAAYCGGTAIHIEEPIYDELDGENSTVLLIDQTTYLGVENKQQFKLAVEWLQERLLMYEMAELDK